MRRIRAIVERDVDDVHGAHGAAICCCPLRVHLRTGEGVRVVVRGDVDVDAPHHSGVAIVVFGA